MTGTKQFKALVQKTLLKSGKQSKKLSSQVKTMFKKHFNAAKSELARSSRARQVADKMDIDIARCDGQVSQRIKSWWYHYSTLLVWE